MKTNKKKKLDVKDYQMNAASNEILDKIFEPKEIRLNIRMQEETRDAFRAICKRKAVNGSELIRQWIDEFIRDNTK